MKTVFIFGYGYVAKFLSRSLASLGYTVHCTSRNIEQTQKKLDTGVTLINFLDPTVSKLLAASDAILSTVPPENGHDPVLAHYSDCLSKLSVSWVGYLSATNVYGDHHGRWVNEESACFPSHMKGKNRLLAEQAWFTLHNKYHVPVHVFRLSGIYGPMRNALLSIQQGKEYTIIKEGHYFSRIHVADICKALIASMQQPTPGEVFNLSDDKPAPLHIVQQFAAHHLKKNPLQMMTVEQAQLSREGALFFNDNKRVSGRKIKKKLQLIWDYPTFKEGLLHGCKTQ